MNGDAGFTAVVAAPGIANAAALKGRTLSVDAMTTGFAFVLREFLVRKGLREADVSIVRAGGTETRFRDLLAGKHDATILRTPYDLIAQEKGFNVLSRGEFLGAFQGTVGIVRQGWARAHEAEIVAFLRAYRGAIDWLVDPANRARVEALLIAHLPDLTPALASRACDRLLDPHTGLSRTLSPDIAGIRTVLALRSKYGLPHKTLEDPLRYVDLTYHEKAFGGR